VIFFTFIDTLFAPFTPKSKPFDIVLKTVETPCSTIGTDLTATFFATVPTSLRPLFTIGKIFLVVFDVFLKKVFLFLRILLIIYYIYKIFNLYIK
jgi:hypothetical protein